MNHSDQLAKPAGRKPSCAASSLPPPLAERGALGDQAERRHQQHHRQHPQRDQAGIGAQAGGTRRVGRSVQLTGPGEEGVARRGDDRLCRAGDHQMGEQHGGDGHRQRVRVVQGDTGRVMEQGRLDAELDADGQPGRGDPGIATGSGGEGPAGQRPDASGEQPEDGQPDQRHDQSHVDDVRAVGQHTTVAEDQRLEQQRDRGCHDGCRQARDHRDQHRPDRMGGRPSGNREVEHHQQEAERAEHRQPGDRPSANLPRHRGRRCRDRGNGDRDGDRARLRRQITVRNVHAGLQSSVATRSQ